jgi:hypothetical protein
MSTVRALASTEEPLLFQASMSAAAAASRNPRHHKEFFAEMTEAYFDSKDFQPFNRAELQTDHPAIFTLLADIWGSLR